MTYVRPLNTITGVCGHGCIYMFGSWLFVLHEARPRSDDKRITWKCVMQRLAALGSSFLWKPACHPIATQKVCHDDAFQRRREIS